MSHRDPEIERSGTASPFRSLATATYERSTPSQRILAFWLVPIVLLFVGGLPDQTQSQWVLMLDAPTAEQLYLSNFVHADVQHLSSNILGYLLVMSVLFPLAALSRRLGTLAVVSVLLLTLLPVITSVYSIDMLSGIGAETVVGFSGVVAGFVGVLPVFIGMFVHSRKRGFQVFAGGAGLMGLELSVVLAIAGIRRSSLLLLAGVSLVGLGFAWFTGERTPTTLLDYERLALLIAALVFVVLPVTLIATVGAGTNVFGHLIGLVGGASLALLTVALHSVVGGRPPTGIQA